MVLLSSPSRRVPVVLLALLAAGCGARAHRVAVPDAAPRGHLLVVGGGPRPRPIMDRFVRLAGGADRARVVVFPMASAEPDLRGVEQVDEFTALGVSARSLNLTRVEAEDPASARLLDGATGIWLCGGDQSRLSAVLKGTPVEAAIRERYRKGAVVGGTSAGAAVLSTPMITGEERRPGGDRPQDDDDTDFRTITRDNVVTVAGLGLMPGAVIDQHFVRRKRHNRLVSLVLENPHLLGVGVDESTALDVRPDGRWEDLGSSVAIVYDARRAGVTPPGARVLGASEVRMHVLSPGSTYDPRSGRATLAER
jgi:cyanophycinase